MQVKEKMTPYPDCVAPSASLGTARTVMDADSCRQVPMVEKGKLIGILAGRDLGKHCGCLEATKVSAAMTCEPVTITPQAPLEQAAQLLLDLKVGALPVVEQDKLVGVITVSDILEAFLELAGAARLASPWKRG